MLRLAVGSHGKRTSSGGFSAELTSHPPGSTLFDWSRRRPERAAQKFHGVQTAVVVFPNAGQGRIAALPKLSTGAPSWLQVDWPSSPAEARTSEGQPASNPPPLRSPQTLPGLRRVHAFATRTLPLPRDVSPFVAREAVLIERMAGPGSASASQAACRHSKSFKLAFLVADPTPF